MANNWVDENGVSHFGVKELEEGRIELEEFEAEKWRELRRMDEMNDVNRLSRKLWSLFSIDDEYRAMIDAVGQSDAPLTIPYLLQGIKWQLSRLADVAEALATRDTEVAGMVRGVALDKKK
jgi:hypothetical protein